jgi:3-isopropylmalate/(R)-2-methylmalate dehydratase small subunit|tara:strand:+ start:5509 stop:6102 length:594 start_codon:yes stop_codon:yes gene_type:complete
MEKFKTVTSVLTPLDSANVDTDQIIPKQFLKKIEKTGFGEFLFYDWRYNDEGTINKNFVLNKKEYKGSKILLARDNFGCGSSREHAPWALKDYGFVVIISTSFADIFYNNCFKNGILPIVVEEDNLDYLFKIATETKNFPLEVNLLENEIKNEDGFSLKFEIDTFRKECLIKGLDDIDLTMAHSEKIDSFEKTLKFT